MENYIQFDGFTTRSNQVSPMEAFQKTADTSLRLTVIQSCSVENSEFRLKISCCFCLVFSVRVCRAAVVAIIYMQACGQVTLSSCVLFYINKTWNVKIQGVTVVLQSICGGESTCHMSEVL